jgi:hypothetical protein
MSGGYLVFKTTSVMIKVLSSEDSCCDQLDHSRNLEQAIQ